MEDGMIEMPEGRLMAAQGPPQTRRDGKICEWDVSVSVAAEEYLRAMAAVYVLDEGEDPVELLIVGKAQRVAELEVIEGVTRAERAARQEQRRAEQDREYLERIKEERSRTITINYDLPIPQSTDVEGAVGGP